MIINKQGAIVRSYNSVLETIGNTPLIKLRRISEELNFSVFAKVEGYNPSQSAKDRAAYWMIQQAERSGKLKPGGTLIEATSGNTGLSLAMISAVKGYKCVVATKDKISKEKLNLLRAYGAKVVICPTNVKPDDPRSYFSQAKRLSEEIENAYYVNQNFNLDNMESHYMSLGPEIWEQTKGKITHFFSPAGTGGTISGVARFLKEQDEDINVIGVDAYGSVLQKYHETGIYDESEIYSNRLEGVGKNIIPDNVDFDVINKFVKVTDKDSAFKARMLAANEGLLVGYSSGSTLSALYKVKNEIPENAVVVLLFSDHGSKYLSKVFNDEWMEDQGFNEEK